MLFISCGTPGRQKITVGPLSILTPGAVPGSLTMGVLPSGITAIFRRAAVISKSDLPVLT